MLVERHKTMEKTVSSLDANLSTLVEALEVLSSSIDNYAFPYFQYTKRHNGLVCGT
jgi:hypothetical protein